MNLLLTSRNRTSLFGKLFKCMFMFGLLICFTNCSGSDDYEIFATINGTITDYDSGMPLKNADVVLSPSGISQKTDANGYYKFDELDAQQYTVTVQKSGYQPNRKTVTAISGKAQQVDIQLRVIPQE